MEAAQKAGDGTRTRDPALTRRVLYQLSYSGGLPAFVSPRGLHITRVITSDVLYQLSYVGGIDWPV